jgi:hypothetical protein
MDPSNNNTTRLTIGGGGGGGGDRNGDNFYERFHMNQYYNSVEDEQNYMDEYTSLIHTYNDFIVNGNVMFSRMEQTLRDNLSRSLVRQTFYYHRFDDLRRARGIQVAPSTSQFISASSQLHAPATAAATAAATATAAAAPPTTAPATRIADVFPRLLSRYINTDISRELRQPIINQTDNIISMLYTVPLNTQAIGGGGGGGAAARTSSASAPTNDQILRATQDTLFSHIISPVNATCPISRDEFNDESEITMLRGCNHIFNRASLREWFVSHSTCPLCRSDIRDYQPPSVPTVPHRNMSIDSVDENHMTFSYDLPMNYTNNQIYHDIVNTVNELASATPTTPTARNYNQYHYDDDEQFPEVD